MVASQTLVRKFPSGHRVARAVLFRWSVLPLSTSSPPGSAPPAHSCKTTGCTGASPTVSLQRFEGEYTLSTYNIRIANKMSSPSLKSGLVPKCQRPRPRRSCGRHCHLCARAAAGVCSQHPRGAVSGCRTARTYLAQRRLAESPTATGRRWTWTRGQLRMRHPRRRLFPRPFHAPRLNCGGGGGGASGRCPSPRPYSQTCRRVAGSRRARPICCTRASSLAFVPSAFIRDVNSHHARGSAAACRVAAAPASPQVGT